VLVIDESRTAGAGGPLAPPVGWGIAGCGWVARDHAAPALQAVDAACIVALYDPAQQALERMSAVLPSGGSNAAPACTTDLAAFLAAPDLDAVYVAAPNHAHRQVVEAATAAGKSVLCEKPLAAGEADAAAMVNACADAGVLLGTAYDQRWHPAHQRLRELLPSLGTITAVRIVYCCWLPPDWTPDGQPHDNWRADPARAGGGAAIDLGPHGLDLVGMLLDDDVVTLSALLQHQVHAYAVDDGALLQGRTAGGVLVDLHVAYNTPDALPRRRLEVVGTRGVAVATDTMGQVGGGRLTVQTVDSAEPVDVGFAATSPFTAQFDAFSAAVQERGPWPYPADRDLRLHRLLLAALAAAHSVGTGHTGREART